MRGVEGYMLRTIPPHGDLDTYLFQDVEHARTWLAGYPDAQTCYTVAIVTVHYGKRPCQRCGWKQEYHRVQRTMSVAQFLQEFPSSSGAEYEQEGKR